jgi:hypothetical protein
MVLDSDDLLAISNAVSESVGKKLNASMQLQFNQFKESLETSNRHQAENLDSTIKSRMDEVLVSLLKKQDDHEAKTDQRLANLENTLTTRQDTIEQKNEAKLLDVQKQLLSINEAIAVKASPTLHFPPLQSNMTPLYQPHPPHPASLPIPTFATLPQGQAAQQQHANLSDLAAITELVTHARSVIGLGPISEIDIDDSIGDSPEQKLLSAVTDFLRKEIGVKEEEIKDADIIKVFPADNPDLQRVYVQFSSKEQAELCLDLTRKLRKPELRVVLYVPRQFRQRFNAMKSEDYKLRKMCQPYHKTRIEYSDTDLALYSCPQGQYRFTHHPIFHHHHPIFHQLTWPLSALLPQEDIQTEKKDPDLLHHPPPVQMQRMLELFPPQQVLPWPVVLTQKQEQISRNI